MGNFLNNFLRGLLLIVPMAGAMYVVWYLYDFLDNIIPFPKGIPGLSFVTVIVLITIFGSIAKKYNYGIVSWFESLIRNIPLLNLIYSSIKDLMSSFVGEEKKFNNEIFKPGFVTTDDLKDLGLPGMITVYLPHSYNFSGNVFLTDKKNIKPLKSSSSDVMKFILSGGISGKIEA